MNPLLERIYVNQKVCHGKPCIKGTRIPVSIILDNMADGLTEKEIMENYPPLTKLDVKAAIAYASEIVREKIIPTEVRVDNEI